MRHFLSKPVLALVLLLLMALQACASSTPGAVSSGPGQVVPNTGGQTASSPTASSATQAMLQSAVQHYQTVGRDQALKDFTNQAPPFNSNNLFVLCIGPDDKITALGGVPLFVGLSADQLSDKSAPFGQLLWDVAAVEPKGSIPFTWVDPNTEQQSRKTMYYQKLSKDICGVVADQP